MTKLEVITHRPIATTHLVPLLFVHGAWHGAWCWEPYFLPYFAEQKYIVHALSLRGHGRSLNLKSMRFTGIADYVMDVAQVANQIAHESGVRPVVIGHSMGGYIVQKYLETHTAPAAVLLASLPVIGTLPFTLRMAQRYPLTVLKALLQMRLYPFVESADLVRDHFFSPTIPAEKLTAYHKKLVDEAFRINFEAGLFARPNPKAIHPTPMLVLAAENDTVFTVPEAQATARAYGTEAVVFPDMAHDMMLEPGWQSVADTIIAWLGKRGI